MEEKTIHFIWMPLANEWAISREAHPLPDKYLSYLRRWQEKYPYWKINVWSGKDIAEFASEAGVYDEVCKLPYGIMRVDVGRLLVVSKFGGIYIDIDTVPNVHSGDTLDNLLGKTFVGVGTNAFLGTSSRTPTTFFTNFVKANIAKWHIKPWYICQNPFIVKCTGPLGLWTAISNYRKEHPRGDDIENVEMADYATHFCDAEWLGWFDWTCYKCWKPICPCCCSDDGYIRTFLAH